MECCCCAFYGIVTAIVIFIVSIVAFNKIFSPGRRPDLTGKHVMVTGGSSGIGLAVAAAVLREGAHVTLLARDRGKLEDAQRSLQGSGKVHIMPCDVCSNAVDGVVGDAEAVLGPVFMLVNCAGYALPARFEDLTVVEVKRMMDVNFTGSFCITQAVVRRMKQRPSVPGEDRRGIVVLTSSQGGLLGIYGFTGYAACKGALIKFAEALHMEVAAHGVSVTVCVPPDTDTPGFAQENLVKPVETRLVSEAASLFTAEQVGKQLVRDALAGRFLSSVGMEGFMLTTLCGGMGPITHYWDFCAQVFLSGIFRLVSAFYLSSFARIIRNEHNKRANGKKRE